MGPKTRVEEEGGTLGTKGRGNGKGGRSQQKGKTGAEYVVGEREETDCPLEIVEEETPTFWRRTGHMCRRPAACWDGAHTLLELTMRVQPG